VVGATTAVRVPFRGAKLERIERAVVEGAAQARVQVIRRGKGQIVWCPLPVELSDDDRATAAVYRLALRVAGVRPAVTVTSVGQGVGVAGRAGAVTSVGQGGRGPQRGSRVGVPFSLAGGGILVRPLRFSDAILFVVVNETDVEANLRLRAEEVAQPIRVRVGAERAVMVLVDKRTGRLIGSTENSGPRRGVTD
jgi:hypothetical protein